MKKYITGSPILSQKSIFISAHLLKIHKKKNQDMSGLGNKALTLWTKAEQLLSSTRCLDKINYALEAEAYYLQVCEKMISQKKRNVGYMSKALLYECVIAIPVIALSIVLISPAETLPSTDENKKNDGAMRNINPFLYAMH